MEVNALVFPVELITGDVRIPAHAASRSKKISPHTNNPLVVLEIEVRLARRADQQFVEKFVADRPLVDAEFDGAPPGSKWEVRQTSFRYSNDSPVRTYEWELKQHESLALEALVVGNIELKPYRYREEFGGDERLTIHACVALTENERAAIEALPGNFRVVRRGINDTAREMRFGQCIWSEAEGKTVKAELFLIDNDPDEPASALLEPMLSNLELLSIANNTAMRELLGALVEKGVLDQAAADGIQTRAAASFGGSIFRRIHRVGDLDEWLKLTTRGAKY